MSIHSIVTNNVMEDILDGRPHPVERFQLPDKVIVMKYNDYSTTD